MANNLLIFGGLAVGFLYFYNNNAAFKSRIDGLLHPAAAAAAPTTDTTTTAPATTVNNYFNCDENGQNCKGPTDSNTLGGGDCATDYGGSCVGECSAGGDKDACKKCQAVCVPASKSERKKKTKKFRDSVSSGPGKTSSGLKKKETKNLVTKGSVTGKQPKVVTDAPSCSSKCDSFKDVSTAIYAQCCNSNFARRLAYYSVGSLYTPQRNCRASCHPWKNINPSVYLSCCQNKPRKSLFF